MAAKIQPVIDEKCSRIKRAVIYARVSSDDRSKEDRNLESQLKMGREYAAKHGYKIVMELPEDDRGASGAAFDLPQLVARLQSFST
jgi:site-specific DNA recombinase